MRGHDGQECLVLLTTTLACSQPLAHIDKLFSFFTECKLQAVSSEASLTCTSFMNEKYSIFCTM